MDIYINYVLSLLSNGIMSENDLKKNLSRKFSLTDSYCDEIISKMTEKKMIESEFNEDFHNMYSITDTGDVILNEQEDEKLDIDYKSLLGEMCDEYEETDEQNNLSNSIESIEDEQNSKEIIEEDVENGPYLKDFSQFKINVKKFNKSLKYDTKSNEYLKVKRLEFVASLLVYLVFIGLTGLTYFILQTNALLDELLQAKFFVFFITFSIYPAISLIIVIFQPNKKQKNTFKFEQSFKLVLLTVCVCLILILALNFLFGLDLTKLLKFLPYWLFPTIVGICVIFYPIFKHLMIKTNKFNA